METATSATAFMAGSDHLGDYAQVRVDPRVFSDTAIFKTAYWFTDRYYLFLSRDTVSGLLTVEFRLKEVGDPAHLSTACGEFHNRLLDFALREKVLSQTSEVRDTLVRKAFFEAKAPLPATILSNESSLPLLPTGNHR
jgi:His-Xaa-Ser system protein HxsD